MTVKVRTALVQRADVDAQRTGDLAQEVRKALHHWAEARSFGDIEVNGITDMPPGLQEQPAGPQRACSKSTALARRGHDFDSGSADDD